MEFGSLEAFAADRTPLGGGPFAVLVIEDAVEVDASLSHLARLGFGAIVAHAPEAITVPHTVGKGGVPVHCVRGATRRADAASSIVNALIPKVPGGWIHYAYNAEFLFYPFCETRRVGELIAFLTEERRASVVTFVVDLYADDLEAHPDGVSRDHAFFDATGYYAAGRHDADGARLSRQLDFHGGLRWRFEEHVAPERRRIDRVGLFRANPGLKLLDEHRLNDEELNTFEAPWHHSPTGAIASFRAAKALRGNPASRREIDRFTWFGSKPFEWSSQQLMDLGLMEPGQWF